jgi:hypothetical protein
MDAIYSLFGSKPSQVNVSGPAVVANAATLVSKNAPAAAKATVACADQLKALGEQLRTIAKVIDENAPAAVQIANAVVADVKNTKTGQAAIELATPAMKGGRRSILSNATISGGVRRYLRAASRTLKQLGGKVTNAGEALPVAAVDAANTLAAAVKKNVTSGSVVKATNGLNATVAQVNASVSRANSGLGTNAPTVNVTAPAPGVVVNAANNAAQILQKAIANAAKRGGYKRTSKGITFKGVLQRFMRGGAKTKKAGKKGKKGGFFTFTPFNPNAAPAQVEGFALAGRTARAGPVTAKVVPKPPVAPKPAAPPKPPARR